MKEEPPEGGPSTSHRPRRTEESYPRPLTDDEVREFGFEPTPRGWVPLSDEVDERMRAADARRTDRSLSYVTVPFRIPGGPVECTVCAGPAAPSTAGTPTCGEICTAILMHHLLAEIGDALYTRADGSGGSPPQHSPPPPKPKLRLIAPDRPSVARALERLGDCRSVLERHGHRVRGRMVFCPFHENSRTPAMSLYHRGRRSRAHCFPCDFDGDALDLEAALAGEELKTTIRRWG